jgi:putative phosphonate metabolism protein
MTRYAIYFAPEPDSRLWTFGCRVLGRDPAGAGEVEPFLPGGISQEDWAAVTASARRYGFHATLKAPFTLAEGKSEEGLLRALKELADERAPFAVPPLTLSDHHGYASLLLSDPSPEVQALAASCVSALDDFRAPMTPQDRARRLTPQLTQAQRQNVDRWGYPYVFGAFTFHMTLAGPLPDHLAPVVHDALAAEYSRFVADEPVQFRSLSLFREPFSGGDFDLVSRVPLTGRE